MGNLAEYLIENDFNFRKARLPALYSDFRSQKALNPEGYRANISAWSQALSRLAFRGLLSHHGSQPSLLVLDADESLRESLNNSQFGQPLALGAVFYEAVSGRNLITAQNFLQSNQSIYQNSWSDISWNLLNWTLRQVGVIDPTKGEDRIPKGRYVLIQNLEVASQVFAEKMTEKASRFDKIFSKAQFHASFASTLVQGQRLSEVDIEVLLKFLSRDKRMVEYNGKTIRVLAVDEAGGITEEDTSIASIKELTANLQHQIDLLGNRINDLDQDARRAVLRNNRVTALAALKAKKLAEFALSSRYASLLQLEDVSSKLVQASDHVQLIKVIESSANALRTLNIEIGGAEGVDRAMDSWRDQTNQTDEVAAILANSKGVVVDEAEVDEEIEALEREQNRGQEEKQLLQKEGDPLGMEKQEAIEYTEKLNNLPAVSDEQVSNQIQEQTSTTEMSIAELSLGR